MNKNIKWKAFVLSSIFDIKSTRSSIDKGKLTGVEGSIPYITRTDIDNGIDQHIDTQPEYKIDEGNVITIGLDTQTVFYQPTSFYTGQNIQILRNSKLNKYIALFIIPLIKKQMEKFNWGGNGATLGRLKKISLVLPSDNDKPDYVYMESYMREVEKKILTRYVNYLKLSRNRIIAHDIIVEWRDFKIDSIFEIKQGVRLTKQEQNDGNIPFIGASDSNNGITAFCNNTNNSEDENLLGVNYNGSVVECFYHPYKALFSDDVKRFHLKDFRDDKYVFLFLKNCILKQKIKYQYGYKFNAARMKEQKIMLPIKSNGEPHYLYMRNYIRKVENILLRNYIEKRLKELI